MKANALPSKAKGEGSQALDGSAAVIRRLNIERFRGIKTLTWNPAIGLNVILGGGDVGKTTILEAIGLLLSPTNHSTLSDADYHGRAIEMGFSIEADVVLPAQCGIDHQLKTSWPWLWDGTQAVAPIVDAGAPTTHPPVYRLRVRGTGDLDLMYEIMQPDGTADTLSVALRRSIGVVRLGGDDRSDRDLRLVHGSALDRLIGDKNLRSRMSRELARRRVMEQLTPDGKAALEELDRAFKEEKLPVGLDLAAIGSPGASIASMVGLTAIADSVPLPLTSWGAGTRRLAALAIAEQNGAECPVTIVDEIERGLEPYRQRVLVERLQSEQAQVFVTTHSPAVIAAGSQATYWYVDHAGNIGPLESRKIARHRVFDPTTFLSRLAVINEGVTEVGFARTLLERAIGSSLLPLGIYMSDGGGHETTLELIEALCDGKVRFGCFADEEGKHPDRWKRVIQVQGALVFRWTSGCTEENVIGAISDEKLEVLIKDPSGEKTGVRLRTLAERLGITSGDKSFQTVKEAAGSSLREFILDAALGRVPTGREEEKNHYKSHARNWFKSEAGGQELAQKVFSFGLWPSFRNILLPFCNAVRNAVDLSEIADLPQA